jgi:hypothetical protein
LCLYIILFDYHGIQARVERIFSHWWGDQGDFGERSTHPKPMDNLFNLGHSGYDEMAETSKAMTVDTLEFIREEETLDQ